MNPRMLQKLFLATAVVLFIVALSVAFGERQYFSASGPGYGMIAPNNVIGLTACGFAIAGGLSLLSAAIVALRDRPPSH